MYDPVRDEFFWAEKGMGVFLNERKVRVSSRRYLDEALVGTGLERGLDRPEMARMEALIPRVAQLRTIGAYALDLAYVAAGRLDAFWLKKLCPWPEFY